MSTPTAPDPGSYGQAWAVTGQLETTQMDAGGRFVDGYQVSFHTALGADGTVFVPRASYTVDNVRAAVAAQAAKLDAVHNLSAGMG